MSSGVGIVGLAIRSEASFEQPAGPPSDRRIDAAHRKVRDREVVNRAWQAELRWPGRALLSMHDSLGGGFVGDVAAALREAAKRHGQLTENDT